MAHPPQQANDRYKPEYDRAWDTLHAKYLPADYRCRLCGHVTHVPDGTKLRRSEGIGDDDVYYQCHGCRKWTMFPVHIGWLKYNLRKK